VDEGTLKPLVSKIFTLFKAESVPIEEFEVQAKTELDEYCDALLV